jgi:hypothetical protein
MELFHNSGTSCIFLKNICTETTKNIVDKNLHYSLESISDYSEFAIASIIHQISGQECKVINKSAISSFLLSKRLF